MGKILSIIYRSLATAQNFAVHTASHPVKADSKLITHYLLPTLNSGNTRHSALDPRANSAW